MPLPVINYSEFATLAACETKWGYGYLLGQEETGERRGLHLGTLIHVWADRWLRGLGATLPLEWSDDINTGGKPGEQRTMRLADFDTELVARATWLAGRYEEHYGPQPPPDWEIVSAEEWLQAEVELPDGSRIIVVGRTDGIIRVDGRLWLREVKSAANIKQRLLTINVEPQPTLYYLLVRANYGEYPIGILYDGVHTYRWVPKQRTLAEIEEEIGPRHEGTKKDLRLVAKRIQENEPGVERPAGDSFQREWPDRTPEQVLINMQQVGYAIKRREHLIAHGDFIANVGNSCNSCGFRQQCWAYLSGDDGDIEIEDDPEAELDFG